MDTDAICSKGISDIDALIFYYNKSMKQMDYDEILQYIDDSGTKRNFYFEDDKMSQEQIAIETFKHRYIISMVGAHILYQHYVELRKVTIDAEIVHMNTLSMFEKRIARLEKENAKLKEKVE